MRPLTLFLLNAYIVRHLFRLEYSRFMRSIESAYIAISQYAMSNWGDLTWFPAWYGGIPYRNTYPPLLHWIVAATAQVTRLSVAHSHHLVTALFYCLGPVTLYLAARRLSGDTAMSFLAGLCYSLVSPAALLIRPVSKALGSPLGPLRLQDLVMYGEGPHVAALALAPLAVLCLDSALAKRTPLSMVTAAAAIASVALTNWLGAFALALWIVSYLLAFHWRLTAWLSAFAVAVLAYLFACPWLPPSTIRVIQFNARGIGGDYSATYGHLPRHIVTAIAALLLLRWLFNRVRLPAICQFAGFCSFLAGAIALSAAWANYPIVPQPDRYQLEMDQAFVLAGVSLAFLFFRKLDPSTGVWGRAALATAVLIGCYSQIHRARYFTEDWIRPIDIRATTEYRIAAWFRENIPDGRVIAPGSPSYWLNTFTATPQLGGGFDQGVVNHEAVNAQYAAVSGEAPIEVALQWLRAFGVQAIAVPGPRSGDGYLKPFRNPNMYDGVLPVIWTDGESKIYRVPLRSASLAHVMRREDLASLAKYAAALENPSYPDAAFAWSTRHSARLTANLQSGRVVSIQESYDPGWQATVQGVRQPMWRDGRGLIAIEPACIGLCSIELTYNGGTEMRIARTLCLLAVAACVIALLRQGLARAR